MWLTAKTTSRNQIACPHYHLWTITGRILNGAVWSLFVNPGENSSIGSTTYYSPIVESTLQKLFGKGTYLIIDCSSLYRSCATGLASVDESSVCYPTELVTLKKSSDFRVSFERTDGMLIFNGRYFQSLLSSGISERSRAKKSLLYKAKKIFPSSIGEHSSLTLTIREKLHTLELGAILHGPARVLRIDLQAILKASIGLERTKACEHSVEDALQPEYISRVLITSVFEPRAVGTKVSIAQVKSNPTAQLLCCEPGVKCVIQSESCLTCAVKEEEYQAVIIVS